MTLLFRKILVANRGEVAIRVLRTCCDLGIPSVAVYSDADRGALHVRYADEARYIGPSPALDSYLNIKRIIDVATQAGAEAIHPGYGFLSENADFARACSEAGIVFIGPSARTIDLLGDKVQARLLARQCDIQVVPGTDGVTGADEALRAADAIGYPVLIKASAGGGGRGIRVVQSRSDMVDALQNASSEAQAAFGDAGVYVEKYLSPVRHIEVQVVADQFGHTTALTERECSIQRRHQKLIEECPSPAIDERLRRTLQETAVRVASAANYTNVGTVEFLLDAANRFYFLEMNTRLQVEHPVTELVTGADIVADQIRIAAGRELRDLERSTVANGWAIECRISAEDPLNNFVPSIGTISFVHQPGGPGVRVDSALYNGFTVSEFYDPLLAKVCTWGRDRAEAAERMVRALGEFKIVGVRTNIPFHIAVMQDQRFMAGQLSTSFLEDGPLQVDGNQATYERAALATAALLHYRAESTPRSAGLGESRDGSGRTPRWRSAGRTATLVSSALGGGGWQNRTS